jgi:hypothetical protein
MIRKIHILMFGGQIVLNLFFSLLLFCGLLGENAIFAFIYPIFVFVYLLIDIFFTTLTTDVIVRIFQNKTACILTIITRDLLIIIFWLCFLLYINIHVLTFGGTLCYAIPKILKIVICDIVNKQRYLHNYILY